MAAKKPSAKATKAKKTVVKKAEPAKKAAPAKKPAAAKAKPPAAAAPRPTVKPAAARPAPAAPPPARPVPAAAKPEVRTESRPEKAAVAPEPAPKPVARPPVTPAKPVPARPVISNLANTDSDAATSGGENDDSDNQELSNTNLLAGPRNVKPYIPRRGEQYMNKEQLEHFRQILNTWKRDLMQEVDRTVLHMKDEAANFPDPNDRATQESEFSLELRTRDRERKLIRKIEEAIKRIEDGTYGYCIETGEEIGIKRLEARPVATLSVEAQERRERREKQYGDRDDRYR
jgi:DnaK suppressor protein